MATRQLALISSTPRPDEADRSWKLDDHTKEVGRAGIARARLALTNRPASPDQGSHPSAA